MTRLSAETTGRRVRCCRLARRGHRSAMSKSPYSVLELIGLRGEVTGPRRTRHRTSTPRSPIRDPHFIAPRSEATALDSEIIVPTLSTHRHQFSHLCTWMPVPLHVNGHGCLGGRMSEPLVLYWQGDAS